MSGFTNKELYELRKQWLTIIEQAKELDNLTPEQLKEYDIHPSRHTGSYIYEGLGKFLDDYYRYAFLRDQASVDPLSHEEIARFKAKDKDAIIKAGEFIFLNHPRRRSCTFYDSPAASIYGLVKQADTLRVVENAIQKATDIITPEYSFYKKDFFDSTANIILKEIEEEIKLNNTQIADHNSSISSIGYDHYEDSENDIEIDYDVNEKYKPHYAAIDKLKANNELLESFKIKLQKELKEEIETDTQQKQTLNASTKKKNLFKRIANRFKKKKANENAADESVEID